ncbi:MAG: hypothetical protein EOO60_05655 [Hymenobacter sp.]|nr:MAG: hypothetical protein EOO60_05655 [Hymenobacter sp.]
MLINGIEYSFPQIKATVAGVPLKGVEGLKYSDKQDKTHNWGLGNEPVSRSYGKYEAMGSLSLHASEVEALTRVAPGGDIKAIPPFDIIVTVLPILGQTPFVHKIRNCEFVNNVREMKQGDAKFVVELELIVAKIDWQ